MYSVKYRRHIKYKDFNRHVQFVNEEQAYCKTIDFSDCVNHRNINDLPSYHPIWSIYSYARIQEAYKSKLRLLHAYHNMIIDPTLSKDTCDKIKSQIASEVKNTSKLKKEVASQRSIVLYNNG